ncbi:MAG TPA: tetratricopeptide repeat protein, partial [Bdellovibrio sp.]|nr:tetratricopeptide repeat protein [Bdellovibrio sp.]
ATDYRFRREFDKALATYHKIINSREASAEDKFQAYKNIRMTFKVAQRRDEYIHASSDLVNWAKIQFKKNKKDRKTVARFHDTQVLFARTLWTEDQGDHAMKVLNETHRLLRGLYPMDEVYMIMGRMEEEKGHFDKAIEYYEASYAQPISLPGLRDKVTWLKSWNYYKMQKWPEARQSFEQMKTLVKEPSDIARARFWLARTLKNLNENSSAGAELETLIKEDPLGYYGMLAYRELGREYPAIQSKPDETLNLSLLGINTLDPQLRLNIEWLISVNEKPFAEKALNQAADDLKKYNVTAESTWLAMSSGYARAGLYLPLFSTIGALQPAVKDQLLNDHPDLLF